MDTRETVWWMFKACRMSPSQIDAELRLISGTAHDIIVGFWVWDCS